MTEDEDGDGYDLVVVANRLPVDRVVDDDGTVHWQQSPGGLVTAMESVMTGREGAWVGWSGDPGEAPEPFDDGGMHLHAVGLTAEEVADHYEGFSNDTLWPLYHDVIVAPRYRRSLVRGLPPGEPAVRAGRRRPGRTGRDRVGARLPPRLVPQMLREPAARRPHRLVQPHPVPLGRACSPACRGGGRSCRGCWAPTCSGSSGGPTPRTSCGCAAGCWRCPPAATPSPCPTRPARAPARCAPPRSPSRSTSARSRSLARTPAVVERARQIRHDLGDPERLLLGVDRLDYTKGIRHRLKAYEEPARRRRAEAAGDGARAGRDAEPRARHRLPAAARAGRA
ncbi:hypothetical protein GCM10025868_28770 [Angustibacter aerolatus]|uniref:Trehalose-6-phosphate synthase n=1 Tax=Angustibacter aerolatus TaxID=1162965 RepID=A0ABQ6JHB9_9ACTN|nr:trehalose-6-phosphate synthase [Angustibacter aerolatus]GMA87627.1 hypothetical protein GCM10025868_28770 [Angustibacter aerolatus]